MIVHGEGQVTKTNFEQARANRSDRLTKLAHETAFALTGVKRKMDEFEVKLEDIPDTDLVFRAMTWDHIPIDLVKSNKAKAKFDAESDTASLTHTEYDEEEDSAHTKYTKCNFPPFHHFKVTTAGDPILVGKSHWKGDLISGEFTKDTGAMTKKLATMFMKLCERYATRSNWRGYTYNDEMRSQALLQLSQIGLQFDESKSQNPFAYYTAAITNSFTRVLNIEKRNQNLRDDILEMNSMMPSFSRQNSGGSVSFEE